MRRESGEAATAAEQDDEKGEGKLEEKEEGDDADIRAMIV